MAKKPITESEADRFFVGMTFTRPQIQLLDRVMERDSANNRTAYVVNLLQRREEWQLERAIRPREDSDAQHLNG